jgi:hypothetical protein
MRKGTLIYSLVLLLILGAAIILMPAGAQTISGSAHFDPWKIDLSLPAPSVVKATIRFESSQHENPRDINASTVLLEGSLPPDNIYYVPGALVAEFDGEIFVNLLWAKIYHIGMLEPPYKVWLTITGNLKNEAGGTPFSATGDVKILVPHTPPPP